MSERAARTVVQAACPFRPGPEFLQYDGNEEDDREAGWEGVFPPAKEGILPVRRRAPAPTSMLGTLAPQLDGISPLWA